MTVFRFRQKSKNSSISYLVLVPVKCQRSEVCAALDTLFIFVDYFLITASITRSPKATHFSRG